MAAFRLESEMEKMTSLIISRTVNWETVTQDFTSTSGRSMNSSVPRPAIEKRAFSQEMVIFFVSSAAIRTSLSGSFRMMDENSTASTATEPASSTKAAILVSMPREVSLVTIFSCPSSASSRTHFRISIVVRTGTALKTVFRPFARVSFERMTFMPACAPL